jgi:hypothetical protein
MSACGRGMNNIMWRSHTWTVRAACGSWSHVGTSAQRA